MATKRKFKYRYRYVGRTSKLNEEMVRKLEEAAAVRATIQELCFYAGISKDTYYRWIKESPELNDRLEDLRQKPFLKARQTIISRLDDVNVAFKFMEKEKPDEYGERLNVKDIPSQSPDGIHPEDQLLREEFKSKLKENIKKRWAEKEKNKINQKPAE